MDRKCAHHIDRRPVRANRAAPLELLLRAANAECFRSCAHETSRRNLHGEALLRFSENSTGVAKGRARHQSKTNSGDHAESGLGWQPTGPQYVQEPSGTHQISLSLAGPRNLIPTSRVEHGHYVHSAAKWICVPGCGNPIGSVD